MREFASEHSYPEPPSALLALWRDPEFLAALGARFGGVGEPQIEEKGGRVLVRTKRAIPVDKVPGFVRRFLANGMLEQVDDWPRDPDPPIRGSWTVSGSMPATMSGSHEVRAEGGGSVVVLRGTVKVNAPLIGGRAEELTVREISKLISRQQEFAASWLAGDRPAA